MKTIQQLSFSLLMALVACQVQTGNVSSNLGQNLDPNSQVAVDLRSSTCAISQQPQSLSVAVGASASFSVVASGQIQGYQWRKNGSAILNATAASYSLASAQSSDAGTYSVVVKCSRKSITSSNATLTVTGTPPPPPPPPPPGISASPTSLSFAYTQGGALPAGKSVALTVPSGSAWVEGDSGGHQPDTCPGFNVTPVSGSGSATVQFQPNSDMTSLAPGATNCQIVFTVGSQTLTLPVVINVSGATLPPPPVCGDGAIQSPETCDDKNAASGDGCSSSCQIESGYMCSGSPSVCILNIPPPPPPPPPAPVCGNGIVESGEQCDDHNLLNGDGCSSTCQVEASTSGSLLLSPATSLPSLAARGSGYGATEPAIADWDFVPYQAIDSAINVGVVAFHINVSGIQKVSFSIGNSGSAFGPWIDSTQMVSNPSTCTTRSDLNALPAKCVTEYFVPFDPNLVADGLYYIHAIAFPVNGKPVQLQDLPVYANSHHSRNQVRCVNTSNAACQGGSFSSIANAAADIQRVQGNADAGTILLGAGSYDGTSNNVNTSTALLTIKAAPGLTRNQVSISGSGGANTFNATKLSHYENVTVRAGIATSQSLSDLHYGWFSNCDMNVGNQIGTNFFSYWFWVMPVQDAGGKWINGEYITDSHIFLVMDGARSNTMVRNVAMNTIGSNALSDGRIAINVSVDGIDPLDSGNHPDVYQGYSLNSGIIIYGLVGVGLDKSRGISLDEFSYSNIALVNISLTTSPTAWGSMFDFGSKVNGTMTNILVSNTKFYGNQGGWIGSPIWSDVVAEKGTTLPGGVPSGVTVR